MSFSIRRTAVIALVVGVLSACGGNTTTTPQQAPQPAPASQAPAPSPAPAPAPPANNGGNSSSGGTTIIYNDVTYNCMTALDLAGPCTNAQQTFFDGGSATFGRFYEGSYNDDLRTVLSFPDVNFAIAAACLRSSFEDFITTLYDDGQDNYAGLNVDRMYPFYQQAVYVFCDNDDVLENNT